MKLRNIGLLITLALTLLALPLATALADKENVSLMKRLTDRASSFFLHAADTATENTATLAPGDCRPSRSTAACITTVMGSYNADVNERIAIAKACIGNSNDSCIKTVMGSYNADVAERIAIAKACANNIDSDCITFVIGNYNADVRERMAVAPACARADLDCAKMVIGTYNADMSERLKAVKSCSGN